MLFMNVKNQRPLYNRSECRRPRWLSMWSACLLRSISWVQVSPSAYGQGLSCLKNDWRKARRRELAAFDENRRAVGML